MSDERLSNIEADVKETKDAIVGTPPTYGDGLVARVRTLEGDAKRRGRVYNTAIGAIVVGAVGWVIAMVQGNT